MAFDLDEWKRRVFHGLREWKPRMARAGIRSIYAFVSAAALWPVVEATRAGEWSALAALGTVTASIGTNLLANQVQKWRDQDEAGRQLAKSIEADSVLREELDLVLQKLDAFRVAAEHLSESDRAWFTSTLRAELSRLGNLGKFELTVLGNSNVVMQMRDSTVNLYVSHASTVAQLENTLARLPSSLSKPQVRQHFRRWVTGNRMLHRGMVGRVDSLRLVHWPIAAYVGQCEAVYEVMQAKATSKTPSLANPEDWEVVQKRSSPIPVEFVIPLTMTPLAFAIGEHELLRKTCNAINGLGPNSEFDWGNLSLPQAAYKSAVRFLGWLRYQAKQGLSQSWQGVSAPPTVFWPNMAIMSRRLGLMTHESASRTQQAVSILPTPIRESILSQARALVEQELSRAIRMATDRARLINTAAHRDDVLLACYYPFWCVKASSNNRSVTVVMDGLTGAIAYSVAPVSILSKFGLVVVIGIIIAAIGLLAAMVIAPLVFFLSLR